jgi:hypothetical protein
MMQQVATLSPEIISLKNLVIVTGVTRSGKFMLTPVIASLNESENLRTDYTIEHFPYLNYLNVMSDELAVYLIRYFFNWSIYNNRIGRNANFRFSDYTSIWNTEDPSLYFKRLMSDEGNSVYDTLGREKRMSVYLFHHALWHSEILFKAIPALKMLHIKRHPTDILYSWYTRGYGLLTYWEHPFSTVLGLSWNDKTVPYYVHGWEEEYCNLSEMDRLILSLDFLNKKHQKTLSSLSTDIKSLVKIVYFEEMVTNPHHVLKNITTFLGREETLHTMTVLNKQRCPRVLKREDQMKKLGEISKTASPQYLNLLEAMITDYESELNKTSFSSTK